MSAVLHAFNILHTNTYRSQWSIGAFQPP